MLRATSARTSWRVTAPAPSTPASAGASAGPGILPARRMACMPDYGHDLRLGSFITPAARDAQDVVALAVRAETLGLDLVTFQDHPYQPRWLDTFGAEIAPALREAVAAERS